MSKEFPLLNLLIWLVKRAKKLNEEFLKTRNAAIDFEKKAIFPSFIFDSVFSVGIGVTILFASFFALNKTMDLIFMLMVVIFVFQFYIPLKSLAGLSPQIYIMKKALDRYKSVSNLKLLDENGKDIALEHFGIEFDNVSFAYEDKEILHNVSFN